METRIWEDRRNPAVPRVTIQQGSCELGHCRQFSISISNGKRGMTVRFDSEKEFRELLERGAVEKSSHLIVAVRTCTISFKDMDGVRHSVDVAAESVYEAAALGIALFYQHDWSHRISPTTQFEIAVSKEPAVTHTLIFGQILKWSEGGGGPRDILKKDRVKALITRGKPEPPDTKPRGYRNH